MNKNSPRLATCLLWGATAFSYLFYLPRWGRNGVLWDLAIYRRAVEDWIAGGNPYRLDTGLPFVYHPAVLSLFRAIESWGLGPFPYAVFTGLAVAFFIYELCRSRVFRADAFFAAFAFGGAGVVSLLSGNITLALHLVLVGLFLRYARTDSSRVMAVIFLVLPLFAVIKPYLLAYVLMLFLMLSPLRFLGGALGMGTVFVSLWQSHRLFPPALYIQFESSLRYQMFQVSDLGFSGFGLAYSWAGPRGALILHLVGALLYTGFAAVIAPRRYQFAQDKILRALFLLTAIVYLNPRMKEYDFVVAVTGLFLFSRARGFERARAGITWASLICLVPALSRTFLPGRLPLFCSDIYLWSTLGIVSLLVALEWRLRD